MNILIEMSDFIVINDQETLTGQGSEKEDVLLWKKTVIRYGNIFYQFILSFEDFNKLIR